MDQIADPVRERCERCVGDCDEWRVGKIEKSAVLEQPLLRLCLPGRVVQDVDIAMQDYRPGPVERRVVTTEPARDGCRAVSAENGEDQCCDDRRNDEPCIAVVSAPSRVNGRGMWPTRGARLGGRHRAILLWTHLHHIGSGRGHLNIVAVSPNRRSGPHHSFRAHRSGNRL